MNRRTQLLLLTLSCLILTLIGVTAYSGKAEHDHGAHRAGQKDERLVVDMSRLDSPVKIVLIKTSKRTIEHNKKFDDNDDWLRGLTLRVVNRSEKTITYLGVQLFWIRTKDQVSGLPAGWSLDYGFDPRRLKPGEPAASPEISPLPPGEEAEIVLSDHEHDEINRFLSVALFPSSRKKLELEVNVIGFSDETMWNNGNWLRRDPTSLGRPMPGWRLIDDPVDKEKKPVSLKAVRRIALLFFLWPVSTAPIAYA